MSDLRPHEIMVPTSAPDDARLHFIGQISTPWTERKDCPRQGRQDGPECRIDVFEPWVPALKGLEAYEQIEVLYWLDKSRRDLVVQNPGHSEGNATFGTFALRSPVRPNPIGTASVRLVKVEGASLTVKGLDCLSGTPLIDLKPDRCAFTPKAAPKD